MFYIIIALTVMIAIAFGIMMALRIEHKNEKV